MLFSANLLKTSTGSFMDGDAKLSAREVGSELCEFRGH